MNRGVTLTILNVIFILISSVSGYRPTKKGCLSLRGCVELLTYLNVSCAFERMSLSHDLSVCRSPLNTVGLRPDASVVLDKSCVAFKALIQKIKSWGPFALSQLNLVFVKIYFAFQKHFKIIKKHVIGSIGVMYGFAWVFVKYFCAWVSSN